MTERTTPIEIHVVRGPHEIDTSVDIELLVYKQYRFNI